MPKPPIKKRRKQQIQRISVFNFNDETISLKQVREMFSQYGRVGRIEIGYSPDEAEPLSPWAYLELHDGRLDKATIVWNQKELRVQIR